MEHAKSFGWKINAAAISSLLVIALLLTGIIGLAIALPGLGLKNWLVVLFGINAGVGEVSYNSLSILNPLDIVVLVLTGLTFVGFWPGLGKAHKVWNSIAVALPFIGIVVLLVTGMAGRSGLMGAGLVMSCLMFGDHSFRPLAYLGVVANVLLLFGDFATSGVQTLVVAALVAIGYVLLIVWFGLIAARLLRRHPFSNGLHT